MLADPYVWSQGIHHHPPPPPPSNALYLYRVLEFILVAVPQPPDFHQCFLPHATKDDNNKNKRACVSFPGILTPLLPSTAALVSPARPPAAQWRFEAVHKPLIHATTGFWCVFLRNCFAIGGFIVLGRKLPKAVNHERRSSLGRENMVQNVTTRFFFHPPTIVAVVVHLTISGC